MFFEYVWHHAQAWSQDQFLLIFEKEGGPPIGVGTRAAGRRNYSSFRFFLFIISRTEKVVDAQIEQFWHP